MNAQVKPGSALPWATKEGGPSWEIWSEPLSRWVGYAAKPVSDSACAGLYPTIEESRKNAAYIIHACNEYPALAAKFNELRAALELAVSYGWHHQSAVDALAGLNGGAK